MKYYSLFLLSLCISSTSLAADDIKYYSKDADFCEVGEPDEVFSGTYVSFGIGASFLDNKYEIADTPIVNGLTKKGGMNTNTQALYGVFGFGGVFRSVVYLGAESELFMRRGSSIKESGNVRIKTRGTYGFNFKLRAGYVFRRHGLILYSIVGADRCIGHISIKNNNEYIGEVSYGSYHPMLGIGVEKKLRNNWSVRTEFSYTIGLWDDTQKAFELNANTRLPFKAKSNQKTVKILISKYF